MATWGTGKATFDCPNCGATYECKYTDYPAPDPRRSFECEACGSVVHSWKSTRDYSEWKLVKHGPNS